jgi:phenylacetate-CoA ligase
LHQWPEFGHIERREDGELVCTSLLNADMPLIRYRVGDRGQHAAEAAADPCPCGRKLPVLGAIDGRTIDVLVSPDGRIQAACVGSVFSDLPVRHSQIIQEAIDRLVVRVAPAPEFAHEHEQLIRHRLQQRMGEIRVQVERVVEVPRTANGKLRAVVCNLTMDQRLAASSGSRAAGKDMLA